MALCLGHGFTLVLTSGGSVRGIGRLATIGVAGPDSDEEYVSDHEVGTVVEMTADDFGGSQVVMMSGRLHSWACVTQDGAVWTTGMAFGTHTAPLRIDKQLFGKSRAVMVACGFAFGMLLTESGEVWTCGHDTYGELGHGNHNDCAVMTRVNPLSFHGERITFIATGGEHSMALSAGGSHLWTWGDNRYRLGVLGRDNDVPPGGTDAIFAVPGLVAANTFNGVPVRSMTASGYFTIVLTVDGSMWGCGGNRYGQLGFESEDNRHLLQRVGGANIFGEGGVRMVSCQENSTVILSDLGQIWSCGEYYERNPTLLPTTNDFDNGGFACIASGRHHSAMLTEDGRLFTFGDTAHGCLGHHVNWHGWIMDAHIVAIPLPDGEQIGRWHPMPPNEQHRALSFAQGTQGRLGEFCDHNKLSSELLEMVWDFLHFRPSTHAGTGLRNLMGFRF